MLSGNREEDWPADFYWSDAECRPVYRAKGSESNPLVLDDLPFTVPEAGRYWLLYQDGKLVQLPESPKGSVIGLALRSIALKVEL